MESRKKSISDLCDLDIGDKYALKTLSETSLSVESHHSFDFKGYKIVKRKRKRYPNEYRFDVVSQFSPQSLTPPLAFLPAPIKEVEGFVASGGEGALLKSIAVGKFVKDTLEFFPIEQHPKKSKAYKIIKSLYTEGNPLESIKTTISASRVALPSLKMMDPIVLEGLDVIPMKYIEGKNLFQFFKENSEQLTINENNNQLTIIECMEIFCNILEAVRVIHQNRYVHKDLKPDNIMISEIKALPRRFKIKIVDPSFIQKEAEANWPVGTKDFAPDAQCYKNKPVEAAWDLHALGKTFLFCLQLLSESDSRLNELIQDMLMVAKNKKPAKGLAIDKYIKRLNVIKFSLMLKKEISLDEKLISDILIARDVWKSNGCRFDELLGVLKGLIENKPYYMVPYVLEMFDKKIYYNVCSGAASFDEVASAFQRFVNNYQAQCHFLQNLKDGFKENNTGLIDKIELERLIERKLNIKDDNFLSIISLSKKYSRKIKIYESLPGAPNMEELKNVVVKKDITPVREDSHHLNLKTVNEDHVETDISKKDFDNILDLYDRQQKGIFRKFFGDTQTIKELKELSTYSKERITAKDVKEILNRRDAFSGGVLRAGFKINSFTLFKFSVKMETDFNHKLSNTQKTLLKINEIMHLKLENIRPGKI